MAASIGIGVCSGLSIRVQILAMAEILHEISAPPAPLSQLSTLTVCCQLKDQMVRDWSGYLLLYAVAKKMKSLALYTHGCSKASLRDLSSFSIGMTINNRNNSNSTHFC